MRFWAVAGTRLWWSVGEKVYYINLDLCWYYLSQHFQYGAGAIDDVEWAQSLGCLEPDCLWG
ncbi:MAG TPA: hypothetical protein VIS55_16920 [Pseudomonadales bacterium]